jgi:hypothetical protein
MTSLNEEAKEYYKQLFIIELESYARSRKKGVNRNAETPELAALLLEKYAYGLAKAAHILEFNCQEFYNRIDELLEEIDSRVRLNRQRRWNARPAGISFKSV